MNHTSKTHWTLPLCSACCLALATAGAEPLPQSSALAGEEAEALLEQRRRAIRDLNRDDALIRQATSIMESAEAIVGDPHTRSEAREAQARETWAETIREIVDTSRTRSDHSLAQLLEGDTLVQQNLRAAMQDADKADAPIRYQLYVSQSMGDAALKTALAQASVHQDMVLVFRGLKRGQTFADLMALVTKHLTQGDAIPRIVIDPTQFTANKISVVPALTRLDANGEVMAMARGVANPRWIEDQVSAGRTGDLGPQGATREIAEVDMIELMKEAAQRVDMEAYGRKQMENYWKQREFTALPAATQTRTREVDPTVVITEAITAPDGTVLAYPGQRLNPLDALPFSMTLLVFNGADDAQVAWVQREVHAREGQQVIVIATEFAVGDNGWDSYGQLTEDIGRMVYLLEPHLQKRLGIERVPSLVEGGEQVLLVHEIARQELVEQMEGAHADADLGAR